LDAYEEAAAEIAEEPEPRQELSAWSLHWAAVDTVARVLCKRQGRDPDTDLVAYQAAAYEAEKRVTAAEAARS
jgi:hypothetical protein